MWHFILKLDKTHTRERVEYIYTVGTQPIPPVRLIYSKCAPGNFYVHLQ